MITIINDQKQGSNTLNNNSLRQYQEENLEKGTHRAKSKENLLKMEPFLSFSIKTLTSVPLLPTWLTIERMFSHYL